MDHRSYGDFFALSTHPWVLPTSALTGVDSVHAERSQPLQFAPKQFHCYSLPSDGDIDLFALSAHSAGLFAALR